MQAQHLNDLAINSQGKSIENDLHFHWVVLFTIYVAHVLRIHLKGNEKNRQKKIVENFWMLFVVHTHTHTHSFHIVFIEKL